MLASSGTTPWATMSPSEVPAMIRLFRCALGSVKRRLAYTARRTRRRAEKSWAWAIRVKSQTQIRLINWTYQGGGERTQATHPRLSRRLGCDVCGDPIVAASD